MHFREYATYLLFVGVSVMGTLAAGAAVTIIEAGANPPGTDSDAEYFILFNDGASAVDLSSYTFDDDADAAGGTALSGSIGAGGYFVVAAVGSRSPNTLESLLAVWGATVNPTPGYLGITSGWQILNQGGDTITIHDGTSNVHSFTYGASTEGMGATESGNVTPFSTIVPEPSTAILGVMGVFALFRRRRERHFSLPRDVAN